MKWLVIALAPLAAALGAGAFLYFPVPPGEAGLQAALDLAYSRGLGERLHSHVQGVRRLYDKAGKDHGAAPFLAAGLELAGVKVAVANTSAKEELLRQFLADEMASKPISF